MGEFGQLRRELRETSAEMQTELGKGEASAGAFGSAATGVFLAVGAAAVALGVEAIHLADAYEASHARLETSVKNVGQNFEEFKGRIDGTNSKMESLGFTYTETENAVARLTLATKDVGKATSEMNLAADISRARHIDLEAATDMLVKVEAGRYTQLVKMGIVTKEQVAGFHSSADAIALLSEKMGGNASAYAETFAGKMAALEAKVKDVGIEIGTTLIPIIEQFVGGILTAVDVIANINAAMDGWVGRFAAIIAIGATVVATVLAISAGVKALIELEFAAEVAIHKVNLALWEFIATNPIAAAAAAVLIVAMVAYEGIMHSVHANMDDFIKGLGNLGDAALQTALKQVEANDKWVKGISDAQAAQDIFNQTLAKNPEQAQRVADAFAAMGTPIADATEKIAKNTEAQLAAKAAADHVSVATETYIQSLKDLTAEINAEFDPLFGMQKAIDANAKALWDAAKAGGDNAAANVKVAETAKAVQDAAMKLDTAVSNGSVSVGDATTKMGLWVAQGLMTQAQADQVAASFKGIIAQADALDGRNIVMHVSVSGMASIADAGAQANADFHGVPHLAAGGVIPGAWGSPVPMIGHGGEYVMTTEMVDAIKNGVGWTGSIGVPAMPAGIDTGLTGAAVGKSHEQAHDSMYATGAIDTATYLGILQQRLAGTVEYSQQWDSIWKQIQSINTKVATDHQRMHDVMHDVGVIANADYLQILQKRLADTVKFSDQWYAIWQQINKITVDAQNAQKTAHDQAAAQQLEILRNQVAAGVVSADVLRKILEDMLAKTTAYTNAWVQLKKEIDGLPGPAKAPAGSYGYTNAPVYNDPYGRPDTGGAGFTGTTINDALAKPSSTVILTDPVFHINGGQPTEQIARDIHAALLRQLRDNPSLGWS
jgi:hypothetical protein